MSEQKDLGATESLRAGCNVFCEGRPLNLIDTSCYPLIWLCVTIRPCNTKNIVKYHQMNNAAALLPTNVRCKSRVHKATLDKTFFTVLFISLFFCLLTYKASGVFPAQMAVLCRTVKSQDERAALIQDRLHSTQPDKYTIRVVYEIIMPALHRETGCVTSGEAASLMW